MGAPCGTRQAADGRDTAHRPRRGAGSARGILAISRGLQGKAGGAGCRAWDGEEQVASGVPPFASAIPPVVTAECRLYQAGTHLFPGEDPAGGPLLAPPAWVRQKRRRCCALSQVQRAAPELTQWLSLLGVVLDLDIEESSAVAQLDDQFRPVRTAIAVVSLMIASGQSSDPLRHRRRPLDGRGIPGGPWRVCWPTLASGRGCSSSLAGQVAARDLPPRTRW